MAPPAGHVRPWRNLAAFGLIVVVLYSLVFFTGDGQAKPKLGIDLQGGTRVTLTARSESGAPPSAESLNLAREIIDRRVNGSGISGAEVVQDGTNLVITVPGNNPDEARSLGRTAVLGFRAVIGAVPATNQPAPGNQTGGSTPPTSAPGAGTGTPTSAPKPQGRVAPAQQPAGSTQPSSSSAAPPSSAPSQPKAGPEAIKQAKQLRQNPALLSDQQAQQIALATLDCKAADPLTGLDDPKLPLVTCDEKGTEKLILGPVFLDGKQISDASAQANSQGPGFVVTLNFHGDGVKTWADFTSKNVGKRAAFVLDTKVVSAPSINEAIVGGSTQITGQFTQNEAQQLANALKYGSLPLNFEQSEFETVSATLGLASLQAGLIAGAIGLALVLLYCLFYYRALGILTALSLVLTGLVVFAVLVLLGRWVGFTLDLAGVAGFIIAIGITADSFIVFFERLKDEVREGRSFRSAVPRSWVRARRTILSADAVSFLAAAVLYILAVGQVKGFAFTLGMSTVLDLVIVFLVTHPLVALASHSKFLSRPGLSGLGEAQRFNATYRKAAPAGAAVKEA
ncbi:protein translocase subunit SecD [Crossiella sp. SN42]|uniref:protein translocase subunit SecD n=1 Tax=Crossiella sp. SN42 TaxID=2944808 RepID=UPI00207D30B7|nr:protein translocase subunit SecD [Crossiella sp. SN42]MCO1578683.1 protein translocase subunit SecD [Crossiella sp. SN42]